MADIKNITIDGTTYDLKDDKARNDITDLKEDFTDLPDYGYVPTAGQMMSDNVTVDTEPYSYRATPYGDREIVDGIVGGTVAFNQLVNPTGITSTTTKDGLTFTNNGDGSVTVNGTNTSSSDSRFVIVNDRTWQAHKYILWGCPPNGGENYYSLLMRGQGVDCFDRGSGNVWNATGNTWKAMVIAIANGLTVTNLKFVPQIIDLTQMFGTSVADAIYAMEQSTAGSGVAYLKAVAPKMFAQYNPYNAGELMSVSGLSAHETVGFNVWDEEWEIGGIDAQTGEPYADTNIIRSKNFIRVRPSTTYYIGSDSKIHEIFAYDANKGYMRNIINYVSNNGLMGIPDGCNYIKFRCKQAYGTTYNHDICINISDQTRNGEYQPYVKHSYALDDSLTLMGVPKWDNGLKFDGDRYLPDGTVERRYAIVDLGTLDYTNGAAMKMFFSTGINSLIRKASSNDDTPNWMISDKFLPISYNALSISTVGRICISASGNIGIVDGNEYSTVAAFKAAMSGVYLVYELATPTAETAEPYQSVQVCPNGGTEEYISTSIVPVGHSTRYPENSHMKLDGLPWDFSTLIAPTEKAYKATRNYTTGQLLIVNNVLYKVTANIANGGNIVPNTNVTSTTLAEVISAL